MPELCIRALETLVAYQTQGTGTGNLRESRDRPLSCGRSVRPYSDFTCAVESGRTFKTARRHGGGPERDALSRQHSPLVRFFHVGSARELLSNVSLLNRTARIHGFRNFDRSHVAERASEVSRTASPQSSGPIFRSGDRSQGLVGHCSVNAPIRARNQAKPSDRARFRMGNIVRTFRTDSRPAGQGPAASDRIMRRQSPRTVLSCRPVAPPPAGDGLSVPAGHGLCN